MLIACHLFFGICAGILLQERYLDKRIIPCCVLGSVLPDLVDKPLGYLIFPEIGDGRLIAHALAGVIIIGIISLTLQKKWMVPASLLTGVIIHQLLDEMWKIPVNWFYPFLGDFPVQVNYNYFGWGMMRELTTPSEWIFALGIVFLLFRWQSDKAVPGFRTATLSGIPALILLIAGR